MICLAWGRLSHPWSTQRSEASLDIIGATRTGSADAEQSRPRLISHVVVHASDKHGWQSRAAVLAAVMMMLRGSQTTGATNEVPR